MQRRLFSLWLPDWPILRLIRSGAVPSDEPVATVEMSGGIRRIAAANAAARGVSIRQGMSLADAQALCPALIARDAMPAADRMALERLALWCRAFSPLTMPDPPNGILMDVTGCGHLFGGEAGLIGRIEALLPGSRGAIAGSRAAAWALARYGRSEEQGREQQKLDNLPLAALDLDASVLARLRRLGLRRIGELARLSRGAITASFGTDLLRRLDQALGRVPEALHFLPVPTDWCEVERHAEPLLAPAQLATALSRLTEKICARLAEARSGMIALTAELHRVDTRIEIIRLGFAAPTRDAAHIARLLTEGLNQVDPGFGVEVLRLEPEIALTETVQNDFVSGTAPDFGRTIDLLLNRLTLQRFIPCDSHVPERAVRRGAVDEVSVSFGRPAQPRPPVLFVRPRPITVIAELPDDPPRLIVWNGHRHRILRADGPERIGREWWRHAPDPTRAESDFLRDYYAVEAETGLRLFVFRAGVHGTGRAPRWFIHGVFA